MLASDAIGAHFCLNVLLVSFLNLQVLFVSPFVSTRFFEERNRVISGLTAVWHTTLAQIVLKGASSCAALFVLAVMPQPTTELSFANATNNTFIVLRMR